MPTPTHPGNKAALPSKPCATCGLPMSWRRRWARNWADVKYCSDACRRKKSARGGCAPLIIALGDQSDLEAAISDGFPPGMHWTAEVAEESTHVEEAVGAVAT